MIFKGVLIVAIFFFVYVEFEILKSDELTYGDKFASLLVFFLIETLYILSLGIL